MKRITFPLMDMLLKMAFSKCRPFRSCFAASIGSLGTKFVGVRIKKIALQNIVCKMSAILFKHQRVSDGVTVGLPPMGLLPDTQDYGWRMRRECRERFPRHWLQRKPVLSDSGMHHGTCVRHVPWCMSESLTRNGAENVPVIPGACATRNFAYLERGPWFTKQGTYIDPTRLQEWQWAFTVNDEISVSAIIKSVLDETAAPRHGLQNKNIRKC